MGTYRVRIITAFLLIWTLMLTATAQADVLVQYAFTGGSLNTTTNATGIAGGTLTNASLISFQTLSPGYSTDPILSTIPPSGSTDSASTVINNGYFSFTVTPTNFEMDLTSLTFKAARSQTGTLNRGWVVRSSIDSFANNIDTAVVTSVRPTFTDYTINLSGALYQNITSVITFRIYTFAPGTSAPLEYDNITLNGTTTSTGGVNTTFDTFDDAPPTLTRYIQVQRSGTTLTAKIYSDENYSVLLDTLTVTGTADTYRYLYAPLANNTGVSGTTFSGSVQNLDVNVQLGLTCDDVCTLCATQATCEAAGGITCYWWDNNSCNASAQPAGNPAATIGIYMTGGEITGCSIE